MARHAFLVKTIRMALLSFSFGTASSFQLSRSFVHRGAVGGATYQVCIRTTSSPCRSLRVNKATFRFSVKGSICRFMTLPQTHDQKQHIQREVDRVESSNRSVLPTGSNDGFFIVKTYQTDPSGYNVTKLQTLVEHKDVDRLEITSQNISVPLALMILDPDEFPSLSRARKACRKANIMIHRGPLAKNATGQEVVFDSSKCERARVGDRVFPGDVLAKQIRIGDGYFPIMNHKKPPFDLPVVFEDDHFAIGKSVMLV